MLNKMPGETNGKQKTKMVRENTGKRALKTIVTVLVRARSEESKHAFPVFGEVSTRLHFIGQPSSSLTVRSKTHCVFKCPNHYCNCMVSPNLIQLKHNKLQHHSNTRLLLFLIHLININPFPTSESYSVFQVRGNYSVSGQFSDGECNREWNSNQT